MKNNCLAVFLLVLALASPGSQEQQQQNKNNEKPGRILFYAPHISRSMRLTFMPLAEELARRGHSVTVVMPFEYEGKDKPKTLEVVSFKSTFQELLNSFSRESLQSETPVAFPFQANLDKAIEAADAALSTPRMKELTSDKSTHFDVVLTLSWPPNESGVYLAHRFKAALVLLSTLQVSMPQQDSALGQPHNPALCPVVFLDYKHPLSFMQRVKNTVATAFFLHFLRDHKIVSRQESLLDLHFPDDPSRPAIPQMERRASLALSSGHPLLNDGMRPTAPNFLYIGMMNCRPPSPLPKDLSSFVDGASDDVGVIYVAFGTAVNASEMSEKKRQMFVNVFRGLKQRVLWKWETGALPDKPPNVFVSKWFPQQDLLGHPRVKLFIGHGGQSGFQEALCHQKPMLVIPVAGDQFSNGRECSRLGFGRSLPFHELTEEKLRGEIEELLSNGKYADKARELGSLLTDHDLPPLERATWWMEYLVRHGGMKVQERYRSPSHDLSFASYFLLDVAAFLTSVIALVIFSLYKLVCCCCCRRRRKRNDVQESSKKKQ